MGLRWLVVAFSVFTFDLVSGASSTSNTAVRAAVSRSGGALCCAVLRQGGMSAAKSYGKAAVKQAGQNLYKGAIIPAVDEGIREAGAAMYKEKGDDGPLTPPTNPLLGVQQTYANNFITYEI